MPASAHSGEKEGAGASFKQRLRPKQGGILSKIDYGTLGASATKAGLHSVLHRAGLAADAGLFARVNDDLSRNPDYYSFLHCDGAGTKSIVAYLCFRETGDRSVFAGLAQDAAVMNIDDIFCLGEPEGLILGNALARNAKLIDDEIIGVIIQSYVRLIEKFQGLGIPLQFSGGETADCADVVRTLLVDAVVAGRIRRDKIIDNRRIVPGDVIIGLSSTGKASYESAGNSGISSNGLTLARHALLSSKYSANYPEVVDPALAKDKAYQGPYAVTDLPKGLNMSVGNALLSPTRSYSPVLLRLLRQLGNDIHGLIHCTGGGQGKVLRFGTGNLYIKDNLFPVPPIFALIQETAAIDWREMYQVFNMGHRLEVYAPKCRAAEVIGIAKEFSIAAQEVGRVAENPAGVRDKNRLQIDSPQGKFAYEI